MDHYKIIIDYTSGRVKAGEFEYRVDKKTFIKVARCMNMMEDFEIEKKYFDFKFVKKVKFINVAGMASSTETIHNEAYF